MRGLVFQLWAFVNTGFRTVVATGHNGTQADLRLVAEEFCRDRPVCVVLVSDPEDVAGRFLSIEDANRIWQGIAVRTEGWCTLRE